MTPNFHWKNRNIDFSICILQTAGSGELCEIKKCKFYVFFVFKAHFFFFLSGVFTINFLTCEALRCREFFYAPRVLRVPARKMRIEVFDGSGNRYTITFEGNVTREKALRLLDLVELLGGMPELNPKLGRVASESAKFDKVRLIIEKYFPIVWFSSKDVQSTYEQEFKEPITLSTVSTYLSRMADRGVLAKGGMSNRRRYRIMTDILQSTLSLMKGNK